MNLKIITYAKYRCYWCCTEVFFLFSSISPFIELFIFEERKKQQTKVIYKLSFHPLSILHARMRLCPPPVDWTNSISPGYFCSIYEIRIFLRRKLQFFVRFAKFGKQNKKKLFCFDFVAKLISERLLFLFLLFQMCVRPAALVNEHKFWEQKFNGNILNVSKPWVLLNGFSEKQNKKK